MKDIYIIDAVNLLFRSYYAIGPMTNDAGASTSAVYGFIRSTQKLIKTFSPTHMVCVFDGPDNKKSRQSVYAEYKMHRKGAPEDLFPQFEWAAEFCKLKGISVLSVSGVEADDTMAAVAVWAKKRGGKAYLCTSDKDLMQLVDDDIFLLHPAKDYAKIDAKAVQEQFGVRPDQMLDLLAIMGDSSDNIPGLPGFGPKTAAALLHEFGSLDAILAHPEKVPGEKKQQTIRTHKADALMSRELATLDCHVEIPRDISFYAISEGNQDALAHFYHTMKFTSLLRETGSVDEGKQNKVRATTDQHLYHLVDTQLELEKLASRLKDASEIGIDTETTGGSVMEAQLVGIGFAFVEGEAWYVPTNGNLGRPFVIEWLSAFFAKTKAKFFGHNLKYDWHVLQNEGIDLRHIAFDTLLASYLIDPQNRRHNLDELALEKFKKVKIPIESLLGKGKTAVTMLAVEIAKVKEYCCEDIDYTARLKEYFTEELSTKKLEPVFYDIEMPLLPILAKMERRGIYLDVDELKEIGHLVTKEIGVLEKAIFKEVGHEFNLGSPKQLSHVLFTELGLKKPGHAKTEFATSADVLEALAEDNPVVASILEYRTLEKLKSTYIEALPQTVHPKTNRIHCTFNQSVAATGRLSSQDPNLQNIPVRSQIGGQIRSCFKPQEREYRFVGADYSQIELRLLAHFSDD
ncbi:MAG: polymerase, partial [Chlamydiota bacterium]